MNLISFKTYCTRGRGLQPPSLPGDVGFNMPHNTRFVIPAGAYAQVKTGIHVQFAPTTWGMIVPRSSSNLSGKLLCLPGVIDQGYTGELTALVHNLASPSIAEQVHDFFNHLYHHTPEELFLNFFYVQLKGCIKFLGYDVARQTSVNDYVVEEGKALCQLVFFNQVVPSMVQVQGVEDFEQHTHRGHNGYGSTDRVTTPHAELRV